MQICTSTIDCKVVDKDMEWVLAMEMEALELVVVVVVVVVVVDGEMAVE
jgi:hypothetical protein